MERHPPYLHLHLHCDLHPQSFRDFLLPYAECVSVDRNGGRLFISDTYLDRILITDIHGKILDSIGSSSPGFEDTDFEFAMMSNHAASYYSEKDDCLYFVDSHNHAVRRADLEKRLVDTVHPPYVKRSSGTWNWILGKLGFERQVPLTTVDLDSSAIESPWHVIGIEDDNLLVIDHSFEIAWVISSDDGLIRETIRGSPSILSLCEDVIEERISLLKCMYANFTTKNKKGTNLLSLVSSIATVDKHAIFADTGSCNIEVFVDVPGGTELLVPLDEKCIWCQVRGSGSEISVLSQGPNQITKPEKVGLAQRWFEELDKLVFTRIMDEIAPDEREEQKLVSKNTMDRKKACFHCAVQISPGTCEVVVSAVLYLSIEGTCENPEEQKLIGSRLLLDMCSTSQPKELESFFKNYEDLRELVFACPVHLRIKLKCKDHPAADTDKVVDLDNSNTTINLEL